MNKSIKRKTIYLQGGFGNILFQLVFFKYLEQLGYSSLVATQLTKKNIATKILGWKIHDEGYNKLLTRLNIQVKKTSIFEVILNLIYGRFSQLRKKPVFRTYFIESDYQLKNLVKADTFFGYYQDKKFLNSNKRNIKLIGEKLKEVLPDVSKTYNTVIHYRYGDSIWAKKHSDYYEKVINHINHSETIGVVTDSPEEAKQFFKDFENIKILNNTPLEDFSLMTRAEILYVAPSTFSYWAYLALDENKTAVLPKMLVSRLGTPGRAKSIIL